ncbi:MAG: NYN domain-containing protein, partial [Planctomycetota bacterium]
MTGVSQSLLLLIDGYNLLHGSDAMHRARDAGWLQRARNRLLAAISKRIDAQLASLTCVVFDAANPPKNRPRDLRQFGMLVRYAVGYREADDLLEEIIGAHATPR